MDSLPGRFRRDSLRSLATLALFLGIRAGEGSAQEPARPPAPVPPPPDFVSRKQPLPEGLLDQKKEGPYVTGIPLVGVDPELGTVLGLALQIFDNGPRTSPFFAYAPYRRQIQTGAQINTRGDFATAY